uniref:Uncharacterized protein n=1 Tax=Vitis vinifera TaxID=29760 RepID=F6HGF6_VITVI
MMRKARGEAGRPYPRIVINKLYEHHDVLIISVAREEKRGCVEYKA